MKRLFLFVLSVLMLAVPTGAYAQDGGEGYESLGADKFEYGVFKHLGVGANISTLGFGFDVATDITKYLGLRAGISFMPGFKFNADVDATVNGDDTYSFNAKGSLGRTTVDLLLDFYPIGGFFITGGFSFGGSRIVKVTGHSDELVGLAGSYIEIDKYQLPVDANGNVNGEIRVNGFRPYLGLGFGKRAVPKSRLGFRVELGVQFHGKPKVLANGEDVLQSVDYDSSDDLSDIVDKLTFYPVLKFRLSGRIL